LFFGSARLHAAAMREWRSDVSSTELSTPVTVTVCATFQLAVVNVKLAGATVPSAGLLELNAMVTSAVGCEVRTTVKVAVPPASRSEERRVGKAGSPPVSLLRLVNATS